MLYTGDWLGAEEARELGVLNKLVPADKLEEETMALARKIASKPPVPNRLVKEMVYKGLKQDLAEHLVGSAYAEAFTLTTKDHKEALAAYLTKREPHFTGE